MGAQIDAKDNESLTTLHCADNAEVAKYLYQKGAKIEAKNKDGQTPLHYAVANEKN